MTEQEKTKIAALREMFETTGWQVFVRDHADTVAQLRMGFLNNVTTMEQLHYLRGWVAAMESIIGSENLLDAQDAALTQEVPNDVL